MNISNSGIDSKNRLEKDGFWVGVVDAENNSGLGGPVNLEFGVVLDLGVQTYNISKISYMCNDGTNLLYWKVLDMFDSTTWGSVEIIPSQILDDYPTPTNEWKEIDVDSSIELSGVIGFVLEASDYAYLGRDENSTLGISYIYYQNE